MSRTPRLRRIRGLQTQSGRGSRRGRPHLRLRVGFLVIAIILSVFAGRLLQLQGFDPNSYATAAAAENRVTMTLPAERGEILDRNGQPLADSVDGEMVTADPSLTSAHAPQLATLLSNELGIDYFTTLEKLRKPDSRFQYIARRVPATIADKAVSDAEAKGYAGLVLQRDPVREYPEGSTAANMIGFMGTDGPLGGLERTFNKQLAGSDGSATYEADRAADGTRLPLGQSTEKAPVNGTNLHLTIDADLQWYVQHLLMQAVEQHRADSGSAVVIDTKTGQVLSLADYPTYDASDPSASPKSQGIPSMTNVYEPGSVEKVLTLSSLIDAGKATDRTKVVVPPEIVSGGAPIHDWFPHSTLHLTLAGVIAQSSNLGTIVASNRFAPGQLRKYLVKFGLGQRTNVGIGGESPGILPSKAAWTSSDEDRIDFGQSLSVNTLQEAAAVNAVANGGVYVSPSIIQGSATTDSGQQVGTDHTTTHRVVSADAAHQMELMMQRVVAPPPVGLAPLAQVPGYLVAGKTGTAQNVGATCGCYDGTFTVSFAGFAPADDPRFTVYVVLHNPKDGAGGGSGAGPVFSKIMSFALRRYGVPPTTTKPSTLPTTW